MTNAVLPPDWGIRPTLFSMGPFALPSYETFMILGIVVGAAWFVVASRRAGLAAEHSVILMTAGLFGAAIGAKLPYLASLARQTGRAPDIASALSGRTILGGVLGAALAVIAVRRRLGLREPIGNHFAPGLALGLAVGRVGCFLRGCCYGTVVHAGVGVDFGDGLARHPTQLYEAGFGLAAFGVLSLTARRDPAPGVLFRALCLAYCAFRFAIEFLREGPRTPGGLTAAQWVCALGGLYLVIVMYSRRLARRTTAAAPAWDERRKEDVP